MFSSLTEAKDELQGGIEVVSMFHVLEHLEDPMGCLEEICDLLTDDGIIIIEIPNADDAMLSLYGCEEFADFTYWESHLYLYNNTTFTRLMEKAGLKIKFLNRYKDTHYRIPCTGCLRVSPEDISSGRCLVMRDWIVSMKMHFQDWE